MKHILVPTDFSACADNALEFAKQSAKILPAKITLLHSFEIVDNIYTDYMGVNKEFNRAVLDEAEIKLGKLKQEAAEKEGLEIETMISKDALLDAIKKSAETIKADLIIMGTQGAKGIIEKLWGSRTATAIQKSGLPIMAIPQNYKWKKPQKILFASNQFEKNKKILNYIFELAGLYMANIQVAVFTDEHKDNVATLLDNKRKLGEYADFLTETFHEKTLTSMHLYGDNFEDTLQDYIKENEIDMVVMITYQHTYWNRLFNPSATKKMSYHTHIPLLAMPIEYGD